ncbi:MAG: hypothetical protein HF967_01530, partial [Methanosarcinales archaeon]|nr:hypothetical protein [Methanosarcinales archaeon]
MSKKSIALGMILIMLIPNIMVITATEPTIQSSTVPSINITIDGAYIGINGFTMTHAGGDTIEHALYNPSGTRIDASDWSNMTVLINNVVTGWEAGSRGDRARLSFSRTKFDGTTLTSGQVVNFAEGSLIEFAFWPSDTVFQSGDVITVMHTPSNTVLLSHEVQEAPITPPFDATHTILHIGDLHGRIDPNMARIATIVNAVKAEQPNTIVVDAGDTLHGVPIANHYEGESVIDAMNAVSFDAMVVGNHDFNFGSETLLERANESNFPILGANIRNTTTGADFLPRYTIVESGGLSIGIVGLTEESTPAGTHARNTVGLEFLNVAGVVQEIVTDIENRTDVIVMLAHMSREEELNALNAVSGKIIASISADTHTTTVDVIDGVILADSGEHGRVIGRLDLIIENGVVVDHLHTFIPINDAVPINPAVDAIIESYRAGIDAIMGEVIGTTTIELDRRGLETNLGNLVADAMLDNSYADVVIQNAGGIRATIDVGDITVGEVTVALPFENYIVTLNLTGAELKSALEHGVSNYPSVHGRHLVVAGINFTFNPNEPAGSRIVDVFVEGEPIDMDEIYSIATNCFLAAGGDDYDMFVGKPINDSRILLRDAVMDYIRDIGTVDVRVDERLQIVDAMPQEPIEQRNVIFIHPDGTAQSHFTAARLLHYGPDGTLNWDAMPHTAISKVHINNSLQAGSVGGAVAHASGYRTDFNYYGLDTQSQPLTTLMEDADYAGFSIGLVNSGSITEPGTGVFVAQVENRGMHERIALQVFEQMPDVVLGGGERWFLPIGTMGRHGEGKRTDGRNLIDEARALGYTVVFNATELENIPANTTKLLGLFATHHIFNAKGECVLESEGLPLYKEGAPTIAEMTEVAIDILSRNDRGFFLVTEEEGTDNFANRNNAEGTIEAAIRADDSIGIALDFADTNSNTLVLVASDSEAGGLAIAGGLPEWTPAGVPLPERSPNRTGVPEGGPIDGVGGTGGIPFETPCGFTFGIAWAGRHDYAGGTIIRAQGLNAEYVSGTLDNTDIYYILRGTLLNEVIELPIEIPIIPTSEQRNVIFIHPDGTAQSHFTAARLLHHGVDGSLNWDDMSHMAIAKVHIDNSLQAGSVGGAVAHASGYRTNFNYYGLDTQGQPLRTLMEDADYAGFSIGLVNSGSITEPGTGVFVAQVENRGMHEEIALQVFEQMPDVVLGGGEKAFLPMGTMGRHEEGGRTDGRNLIDEARALGYTVVFNATELENIPA